MQQLELQLAANAFRIICFVRWAVQSTESTESPHPGYLHAVIHVCAAPPTGRSQACCRGRGSAFVCVLVCITVYMQPRQLACTYTLTLICVPGGDPRAPKQCRLSFVCSRVTCKCASCLPAQPPGHTVHTRRCCSCCCSHFSCCCCLLLSLLLVICRRVRGRLRVRTNKYCNDVCDFFYAPMCYTKAAALPSPLPACLSVY